MRTVEQIAKLLDKNTNVKLFFLNPNYPNEVPMWELAEETTAEHILLYGNSTEVKNTHFHDNYLSIYLNV